jgi:hypothetical protein
MYRQESSCGSTPKISLPAGPSLTLFPLGAGREDSSLLREKGMKSPAGTMCSLTETLSQYTFQKEQDCK